VVYRLMPFRPPWTRWLEHFPEEVQDRDLDFFDHVLVHVPLWALERLPAKLPRLEPIAGGGKWWLCRVRPRSGSGEAP